MTRFRIGDEEFVDEVNTSYDQDQEIGDEPQALNTELSGAEPIDAPTGEDFYAIQRGDNVIREFKSVWKELGYEGKFTERAQCEYCNKLLDEYTYSDTGDDYHYIARGMNAEIVDKHVEQEHTVICPKCNGTGDVPNWKGGGWCDLCAYNKKVTPEQASSYQDPPSPWDDEYGDEKFKSRDQQQWYYATDQDYLDDEPHEARKVEGEKLNKDGTGTPIARRGIDPNNKKHEVMKFDYVSKAGCDICAQYDGKTFGRDSPNRPVIPRLEKGDGKRPYTHPNCKCRWTKVFNEVDTKYSMKVDPKLIERCKKMGFCDEEEFDKLSNVERNMLIIKMLSQDLGFEAEASEISEIIDPVPLASIAKLAFDAIKDPVKARVIGEAKTKATEESPYGIQPMLDQFVGKGLNQKEKEKIEEEVKKEFTLDNLLELTAKALADKAGKKMGLESYNGIHCRKCGTDEDYDEGYCKICYDEVFEATEGGRGSGKKGHQQWMLGTELGVECPNCMIAVEWDNGHCMICGNDIKLNSTESREIKECDWCEGNGLQEIEWEYGEGSPETVSWCRKCDGIGKLVKEDYGWDMLDDTSQKTSDVISWINKGYDLKPDEYS